MESVFVDLRCWIAMETRSGIFFRKQLFIMSSPDNTNPRHFNFDDNPETASTLPAYACIDRGWFELEKKHIFNRNWRCVGHVNEIASGGDCLTDSIIDQPIFVLRCRDGAINAFHNACRHRAHPLLTEARGALTSKLITCPCHAWVYDSAGQLQTAPHCESIRKFDKSEIHLEALKVEIIAGFIFDIAANRKNVGDNLLECCHCQPTHKAFVDLVDMESYSVEATGLWSWQGGICRTQNCAYILPADLWEFDPNLPHFISGPMSHSFCFPVAGL